MKPNERMKASPARMMSLTSDRFIARPSPAIRPPDSTVAQARAMPSAPSACAAGGPLNRAALSGAAIID